MIELRNVGKYYGNKPALQDVSFSVDKGNIVGLLGKNGAGKSTLMNVMTGYLPASAGAIMIDGVSIDEFPQQVKAKLGYLPEKPPLYEMMTVREFLTYAASLKGIPARAVSGAADQVIDQMGISDVNNRLITNLSKGYQQRVGIAQAMIGNPDILILDEPTVGLDPSQVVDFRRLLKEYGKDRIIIISSHILSEIAELCDRSLILKTGRLIKDCSASELKNPHQNHIFVRVDVTPERFAEIIKNSRLNCRCTAKGAGEPGCSDWVIKTKAATVDIRREIFAVAVQHQINILQLIPVHSEIEDIFLDVTADIS